MTPLLARHEFAFHQLQWLSPFMAVGCDRLVPKLAAFAISLSIKQIFSQKTSLSQSGRVETLAF
jgi:hypothetical protein